MQLDIGFGDVITPEPTEIEYPIMLDFPPELRAYPKDTVVAEKLETLTTLGLLDSRIKITCPSVPECTPWRASGGCDRRDLSTPTDENRS